MEKKNQPRYNEQMRSKATISAVLRAIVAFYLAYLGWTIAQNSGGEDTSMEPWMGWAICAVFFIVGIAFGVYTLKRYQADLKDAELPPEGPAGGSEPEELPDDEEDAESEEKIESADGTKDGE